jgi:HlyD family secretion protein
MAQARTQANRGWLWLGAGVVLVLVYFGVRSLTRERLPVRVSAATRGTLTTTISTNGHVEPEMPYRFYSPISTTVKAVHVQPGDKVKPGELLLELDATQAEARLASAVSGVKAAQAALEAATHNGTLAERQTSAAEVKRAEIESEQAGRNLDALVQLNKTGAASASEVAAARQQLESSQAALHASQQSSENHYSPAEVERARAALADAEQGAAAAREIVGQCAIHAPVAGTVYTVDVGRTEFAEQGKMLMQMADLHRERIRGYFDEPQIGQLAVGQAIEIKWEARPNQLWHGHMVRTPITVTAYANRNVGESLIDIDDADGQLLPDTNVTLKVTISSENNALNITREALHLENGKYFVYKVTGDELYRTPVTIGPYTLTQVAILSGLTDGDWVAMSTTNGQPLQEGVPIKVQK